MRRPAYTLVELMLTIALLGVLAGLAVPRYDAFVCESRQVEAKTSLAAIHAAEAIGFADRGRYLAMPQVHNGNPDGRPVDFALKGKRAYRYWAELTDEAGGGFVAYAFGEPGTRVAVGLPSAFVAAAEPAWYTRRSAVRTSDSNSDSTTPTSWKLSM